MNDKDKSFVGNALSNQTILNRRKLLLLTSIFVNIGILGVFKYFYADGWDALLEEATASSGSLGTIYKVDDLSGLIVSSRESLSREELTSSNTLRYFVDPIFHSESGYYYFSTQWGDANNVGLSFDRLRKFVGNHHVSYEVVKTGSVFRLIKRSCSVTGTMCLLPKPFLLLAGISGTGKTRFVRRQAEATGAKEAENFCQVPVRPDWHEPSDLLGYVSRIGRDGDEYVPTKFLTFLVKAWEEIFEKGREPSANPIQRYPVHPKSDVQSHRAYSESSDTTLFSEDR